MDKNFKGIEDTTKGSRFYHATLDEIISNGVPYDVTAGTKTFGVGGQGHGMSGIDHRYKTPGHDPLLGYVFGTANIMTGTLTNYQLSTYHVAGGRVINQANTVTMFEKVFQRSVEQPEILAASVIKQYFHIKSDVLSKNGLPIPTASIVLSPETAQKLANNANFQFDFGNLATVRKQIVYAVIINKIISMIHGLFYDETVHGSRKLYEVRTRKILSYSNTIASVSNIIQAVFRQFILGDANSWKSLDIGGFIISS